jgi:hypothetical protein
MGAGVVRDVELAADVEYRDGKPGGLDLERVAGSDLISFAEFDAYWHRLLLLKGEVDE